MISIGADYGGPELQGCEFNRLLMKTSQIITKNRSSNYSDGIDTWVNAIYLVPGSLTGPDFSEYRLGHFSRKEKGVVVMIAVPDDVVNGNKIPEFIVASLRDAVSLASRKFSEETMSFSTLKAEIIIQKVEKELLQD